jgi:hypothetical protein
MGMFWMEALASLTSSWGQWNHDMVKRMQGLSVLVVTVVCLALAGQRARGDSAEAAEQAISRIDQKLALLEPMYDSVIRRLKEARADLKSNPSVATLALVNTLIRRKYALLGSFSKLVTAKVKAARPLPISRQLRLVDEELRKARQRNQQEPSATATALVTYLIRVRAELQKPRR